MDDVKRCKVCDWPLAASAEEGCVEGDCCYRPGDPAEQARIRERRAMLAAGIDPHAPRTAPDTSAEDIAVDHAADETYLTRASATLPHHLIDVRAGDVTRWLSELTALRARAAYLESERVRLQDALPAEQRAAYRRGAEAMRERAAQVLDGMAALDAERMAEDVRTGDERGAAFWRMRVGRYETAAKRIRALPLTDDAGEESDR